MTDTTEHTPQSAIDEETRRRALDGVARCMAMLLGQVGGEYEHCGKTACRRSRRCRGFACAADLEGDETQPARLR